MSDNNPTITDQGATKVTPEQPKPQAPPATEVDGQRDAADMPLGDTGLKALRQEREQRELLERELKPLKEQMEALRGVFVKKDEPGVDLVKTLQEQFSSMQKDNLVNTVARRHGITDDGDIDFLRTASDETQMLRLAERLKVGNSTPNTPAPDPSQGSAPMSAEAAAAAEYDAFFPQPSK